MLDKHKIGLAAALSLAGLALASAPPGAGAATASIGALRGVACVGPSHCWAVGASGSNGIIIASTDGGRSWTTQLSGPSLSFSVGAIACASSSRCWAVGATTSGAARILATRNGGASWHRQDAPSGIRFLAGISCPETTHCWAVGDTEAPGVIDEAVIDTSNGGKTWSTEKIPKVNDGMGGYVAVSCTSERDCVVAGYDSLTTTDGGRTWTAHRLPSPTLPLVAVSCRAQDCVALGYSESAIPANESADIISSTDRGRRWHVVEAEVPHVTRLLGASCPATTSCTLVGQHYRAHSGALTGAILTTSPISGTTTSERAPAGIGDLASVSCPTTTRCVAVGSEHSYDHGAVATSVDGGRTWRLRTP